MTPGWFIAALLPMIASQILRLHQHDPASWIFLDYGGRLSGLAVLAAIPAVRAIAFRREARRRPLWEIVLWISGIVLVAIALSCVRQAINAAFPMMVLGGYPRTYGWLRLLDLTFGLALVAVSEEIVFRRCSRLMLRLYLGDSYRLVVAASLLFGCYHWWAGPGAVINAAILGALFMMFYRRSGVLWPAVLAHYLVDFHFF
jgi:membrane protease YdiL (CAAX protease family)